MGIGFLLFKAQMLPAESPTLSLQRSVTKVTSSLLARDGGSGAAGIAISLLVIAARHHA